MNKELLEILRKIRPDIDYEKERHLLSEEILDSFDVISILAELSEVYGIEIAPEDVNEEFFDDIYGLERLINKSKQD